MADVLPGSARLAVPVLSSTGGGGRSVVAALLANALSQNGFTGLLDLASRWRSPWPSWTAEAVRGVPPGMSALPPTASCTRHQVQDAAVAVPGTVRSWQVLTDPQAWEVPPLDIPQDPAAWYQLAAVGGWQAVVFDTVHHAGEDIGRAPHTVPPGSSVTARWYALPCSVPVWCAPTTGQGATGLLAALAAADRAGLPLTHTVVAFVDTAAGRTPAPVRAAATMLAARVHTVADIPYDARLRSHGPLPADKLGRRTAAAGRALADAVLAAAHARYGDPLPAAPQPAPLATAEVSP